MKFLLELFKKAPKGDNFRAPLSPEKYNDGIAQLNSLGDNQYQKVTTQTINKTSKTKTVAPTTTQGNSIAPGTR